MWLLILILVVAQFGLAGEPVPVIFDTDMGNDVDDAIALAMLHALESRGESKLLAVTVTKDGRLVDAKSILDLLTLAADRGSELIVDVSGEDEEEAMKMVVSFLEGTCG